MNPSPNVLADQMFLGYLDAGSKLAPLAPQNRRPTAAHLLRKYTFTGSDYSNGFQLRLEDELLNTEDEEPR